MVNKSKDIPYEFFVIFSECPDGYGKRKEPGKAPGV